MLDRRCLCFTFDQAMMDQEQKSSGFLSKKSVIFKETLNMLYDFL